MIIIAIDFGEPLRSSFRSAANVAGHAAEASPRTKKAPMLAAVVDDRVEHDRAEHEHGLPLVMYEPQRFVTYITPRFVPQRLQMHKTHSFTI
jgi:hypothetical protein